MTRSSFLFHPRRIRLLAWLDADDVASAPRLTTHLESCRRCAARLDSIAGAREPDRTDDIDAADGPLAMAIRDVWTVPDELPARIHRAIDRREREEREIELLLGLVSLSKDTAELLLPSDDEQRNETEEDPS